MVAASGNKKIFVTGSAGFIGFHLVRRLLESGNKVSGYDGFTDYYDVTLKKKRNEILQGYDGFINNQGMLEDAEKLSDSIIKFQPDIIIHLAAQAGVRYSIENPSAYISSNIIGTYNILEISSKIKITHLMMASTSSVYGSNDILPFKENEKADNQITLYAATKKSNEVIAHSYSHLWSMPTTMFRFFTVYGPWGRPDLALFKFVDAMLSGRAIDVYNNGEMYRDFTYVDDLVKAIELLISAVPELKPRNKINEYDSLSPVAPFRIVNIGNQNKVRLLDFIDAIEQELGIKADRNYMPIQIGDVLSTCADTALLEALTGYTPNTNIGTGIKEFISWFRSYYNR